MNRHVTLMFVLLICIQNLLAVTRQELPGVGREAMKVLVYAPRPEYPVVARARRITGKGVFVIRVHVKTGRVAEVRVAQSTGYTILDTAAVRAFGQWRFKPGALKPIGAIAPQRNDPFGKEDALFRIPLDFTMQ
jgi:TonB family protein